MNFFRQILEDTASLGRDLRRGWAHVAWRLSWWRRRRGIQAEKVEAEAENVRRSIGASSKMCRECRALIPASAGTCPECGARTAHIQSGGVGRALAHLLPFEPSVSMLLVTAFFALYLVGFFVSVRLGSEPGTAETTPFAALMNLDSRALIMTGANYGPLSARGEPWRLLTAIFLHAGILHILFNTWALRTIGPLIENLYGPRKMFVLYLATGVLSNVASLWWHGLRLLQVGASGAIFGLIGVGVVYGLRRGDALGQMLRSQLMSWAIYGVVMGFLLHADNAAHIGGFLAGAAMAYVVPDADVHRGSGWERFWTVLSALGLVASVGAFALIAFMWAGAA
ncbi:MAG: rhomboid family intramembrane serine protease [Acidobacteria bacterium]|nr:rhomboid family intramembrane serine protease [Acidobacteriota bacterium]